MAQSATPLHPSSRFTAQSAGIHEREDTTGAHIWHYQSSSCYMAQSATPLHASSRFTAQSAGIHEREDTTGAHILTLSIQ